jgi:protein-S-isoprenylcysteine O-methyltransferase Ste14
MFFLAGVGVLRLLWLPFIDSEIFFRLGLITYVPVWVINSVITWIARLVMPELSGDFSVPVSFAFMVVGLAIFFLGVMTWVSDKLGHRALSTRGVYRLSRHPQYLGFIIWSYGLLSLASVVEGGRGWSPPAPGLPWLIAVSIVLGVALIEEIELRRRLGVEYLRYAEQTPFIMLVPKVLSNVITYPVRILIGKEMPESRAEVAVVMFFYLLIAVITSYIISYLVI